LPVVHVSYNCTLFGRIGNNYVVVKMLLKLIPNKQHAKIFVVRINRAVLYFNNKIR